MCLMPTTQHLLYYYLALSKIPGIGPVTGRNLIHYVGGIEQVFDLSEKEIQAIPGLNLGQKRALSSKDCLKMADEEMKLAQENQIGILSFESESYPYRLKQIADAPLVLFYRGQLDLNALRTIGIVGTRNASAMGMEYCRQLVLGLREFGSTIVSGMAAGIDGCAHRTSLQSGLNTVGVVAHGFKYKYPASNAALFRKMEDNGMIITEHFFHTYANKDNFPRRNRLVAALSDVVVVVESKRRGGSMITANLANDFNKEVFAMPGRISDLNFEGCNALIRQNKAHIFQSVQDMAFLMRWSDLMDKDEGLGHVSYENLSVTEKKIINYLRMNSPEIMDNIAFHCSVDVAALSSTLLNMEFKGLVKALPGSKYMLSR